MSIINFGIDFQLGILFAIVSIFLVGFIPGLYISLIILINTKRQFFFSLLLSFFIGILIGITSFKTVISLVNLLSSRNISEETIVLLAVIIEISIIFIHYFLFQKPKKKK